VSLAELSEIQQHYPQLWAEAAHLFTETLYDAVGLDAKVIQLVLCSLLAARGWVTGLRCMLCKRAKPVPQRRRSEVPFFFATR